MILFHRSQRATRALPTFIHARSYSQSLAPTWLAEPVQSYISTTRDPYVNLSIEHYLLQKSDPNSAVLFLYVNRPSIIIGRNQNPWLEVNLSLLHDHPDNLTPGLGNVDLVRRRSGGGTVFHDEGNVNWTIISPPATFTRDKHAEMVVRGLRGLNIDRVRINERHDIVMDRGESRSHDPDPKDTHATPYQVHGDDGPPPLKVSGSAYKLTRGRALHHGTCLLSSPHLDVIPRYLRSPAKPYITARGVESVSSPVGNIGLSNDDFIEAVQREFLREYQASSRVRVRELGPEALDLKKLKHGLEEMKSKEWTYTQTPQFTLSTKSVTDLDVDLDLTVRYGAITEGTLTARTHQGGSSQIHRLGEPIVGQRLHEIGNWGSFLKPHLPFPKLEMPGLLTWLEHMIPRL